jgi:hypothetical protein
MSEENEMLVFDKQSGELARHQARRRRTHITALTMGVLSIIVISALVVWNGSVEAKVENISDFQVNQEGSYLKFSFGLLNTKNEMVSADGTGQLYIYSREGYLIYNEKFSFSRKNFEKRSQDLKYSWEILKTKLIWKPPEGEITVEYVQKGFAVLKLVVNGGETTLTARTTVTFYSKEEAENIIKEIHRKSVLEKLRRWLWQNRYAISEFGSLGFALDLEVMDITVIGKQAWAVGYLPGIGGYGHILHSSDGGNTWEIQWKSSTYGPNPFKVVFLNETEGWVAADDVLLHTTDGGITWSAIWSRTQLFGGYLEAFQVIDRENLQIGLSDGEALHTFDGGKTWQSR